MKVVACNIRSGFGLDHRCNLGRIVDAVRGADNIGLQEVERSWRRSGMVDQPARLGELLAHYYWVYGPSFDVDASSRQEDGRVLNRRRQFGPMLLSKWPILSTSSSASKCCPEMPAPHFWNVRPKASVWRIAAGTSVSIVPRLPVTSSGRRERFAEIRAFRPTAPARSRTSSATGYVGVNLSADLLTMIANPRLRTLHTRK